MAYVSMRMIAQKAGVSAAAVSMALRKQPGVSPALALKIQEIARSLNYQPPALLQEAMGRLRMQQPARFHSQVAFCTDADYRTDNFDSLTRRARNLGYGLDIFRLHQMTRKELRSALLHRNVRGILLNINSWAFADLEFLWEEFACVSLGYNSRRFGLPVHYAESDRFEAGRKAAQEVSARGYSRMGLVRSNALDPGSRWRSGIYSMSSAALAAVTFEEDSASSLNAGKFMDWFRAEQPDCILTMLIDVRDALSAAGYRIPGDIGLVHLSKAAQVDKNWAGVDPLQEEVEAAGLNKLVSMLRQGESGVPPVQQCILVEGVWSEGSTLRPPRDQLVFGAEPPPLKTCVDGTETLKCLNLRPYVNQTLTGFGGWFGDQPLQHCPPGEHKICGTRFQILDDAVDQRAVLIMGSHRCPGVETPNPLRVDIPIDRRIKSIHFLHGCGWAGDAEHSFASYHLIDTRGGRKTLPLVARREVSGPKSAGNIQDFWPLIPPLTAENVRPIQLTAYGNREDYEAYLYILEWVNPSPRKLIRLLRITSDPSAHATLGVLAITLQL